jgi:DNA-binding response OmpR family regulator
MTEKILLVDDDVNVLDGLKRQLRGQFTVDTAPGSKKLHILTFQGPLRCGSRFSHAWNG